MAWNGAVTLWIPCINTMIDISTVLPLTVEGYDPGPGQVSLVAHQDHGLVLGIALSPEVVEDVLGALEGRAVHHRVDHDARVRLVRRQ